ncbi:MAG: DUF1573 domain-containing protein [Planctomycetota bacterium]|nr:MAG: DUF1573 domain-containing protein [Planctomycetota bacterium]
MAMGATAAGDHGSASLVRVFDLMAIALLAAGLGLIGLFCWNPWQAPDLEPYVSVTPTTIDFGTVDYLDEGKGQVTLRNDYRDPIRFRVEYDCQCVTPHTVEGQVAPGDAVDIGVTFRPRGDNSGPIGEERSSLAVVVADRTRMIHFPIETTAVVTRPVAIDRDALQLHVDALRWHDIRLPLSLREGIESIEMVESPPWLHSASLSEVDPRFQAWKLTGRVEPGTEANSRVGTIRGRATLNEEAISAAQDWADVLVDGRLPFLIPITIQFRPPCTLSPSAIHLDEQTVEGRLEVVPAEHVAELEILEASTDLDGLDVRATDRQIVISAQAVEPDPQMPVRSDKIRVRVRCANGEGLTGQFDLEAPVIVFQ